MTIQTAPSIDNASLRAEYARLALLASQGDEAADKKLLKLERQIAEQERKERRAEAVKAETQRLAAATEQQERIDRAAENERLREVALEVKERTYGLVQQIVEELVVAVRLALRAGADFQAVKSRLGLAAGREPSNEITDFIGWRLGDYGDEDCAGLKHMQGVLVPFRLPLVGGSSATTNGERMAELASLEKFADDQRAPEVAAAATPDLPRDLKREIAELASKLRISNPSLSNQLAAWTITNSAEGEALYAKYNQPWARIEEPPDDGTRARFRA
jgi:hypothetical protein